MKACELMIGNIVSVDGVPQRIRSITKRKVGYCRLGSRNQSYARLHEVKPIPITVEFLQKNGFELDDVFIYDRKIGIHRYIVRKETFSIFIGFFTGNMNINVLNKDCVPIASVYGHYVHQIQNLLNLCNFQWEVKI